MHKPMPIGVENFEQLVTEEYYYIDKTLFVKEIIDRKAMVNLFTRPRRFGKTLVLSMLQYYFEDMYDRRGNHIDNSMLFEDKLICKAGEKYQRYMGNYPVISVTLKSGKQSGFEDCMHALKSSIASEYKRHSFILQDETLDDEEKDEYRRYMRREAEAMEYKNSLKYLCECLEAWYGKKVIVLIDEYDVPLEGAYHYGFYDQMVDFIRGLFENTLKTNNSLYFSVITGCLRISKESIFTGLNNIRMNSVLSMDYGEFFGFTDEEVLKMCEEYDLLENYQQMKEWYNGYLFGDKNVYNPWSCVQYMYDHMIKKDAYPQPYWVNTSSNSIVRDLITHGNEEQKHAVESLIAGGSITIPVHEDITYDEVYKSPENLWNFMYFTGYLKKVAEQFDGVNRIVTLNLPNTEIKYIFCEKVRSWFQDQVKEMDRTALFMSVRLGDTVTFTKVLKKILQTTISFYDYQENFYHGLVTGILTGMTGFVVKSNREGGTGRSDLFIKPISREDTAIIIEFKIANSLAELPVKAEEAIQQILEKQYEQELYDDGYIQTKRYGIAFFKKDCLVISK